MPQSNSNLQSYAKLPAAKNNSPKIPQISQNISLRLSLRLTQISQIPQFCTPDAKSHRCFTHPCSLRLTQISQIPRFCTPDAKSHRSSPHLCSLRLTQIQRDSTKTICVSFGNLSTRSTQSTPTRSTTHLPTSVRFNTIKRKIQ